MTATALRLGLHNVEIRTYHSAAGRAYGCIIHDDVEFIEALRKEPSRLDLLACHVLMLDETQDMTIVYYLFIEKLVRSLPRLQLIVVGDPLQSINQYMGSRVEFLTNCDRLPGFNSAANHPWVESTLSTSYRLTPATANFVNKHLGGVLGNGSALASTPDGEGKGGKEEKKGKKGKKEKEKKEEKWKKEEKRGMNKKGGMSKKGGGTVGSPGSLVGGNLTAKNLKPRYIAAPFKHMPAEIWRAIKEAITTYGQENVAIIAPSIRSVKTPNSNNPLAVVVREYLAGIPLYIPKDDEVVDEDLMRGKLTIASWNSTKGREWDCVIVMNFDETYFQYFCPEWEIVDEVPNIMYVAATRARKELMLVADPEKTLRTINLDTLKDDVLIVGNKTGKRGLDGKQRGKLIALKKSTPSGKKSTKKKKIISVVDLLKHMDSVTTHALIKMITFLEERKTRAPKSVTSFAADDTERFIIEFSGGIHREPTRGTYGLAFAGLTPPSSFSSSSSREPTVPVPLPRDSSSSSSSTVGAHRTSGARETPTKGGGREPSGSLYYESVAFLYGLVVPAVAELRAKGFSQFAKNAHIPKIVDTLEDIVPFDYCITRAAYNSFPSMFWEALKTAYAVEPSKRKWTEWFRLAVAENMFNENGHHTARQITHYKWIDEAFVEDAINCLLETLMGEHTSGLCLDPSLSLALPSSSGEPTPGFAWPVPLPRDSSSSLTSPSTHIPYRGERGSSGETRLMPPTFEKKLHRSIDGYDILGVADYIAGGEGGEGEGEGGGEGKGGEGGEGKGGEGEEGEKEKEIWEFRCVHKINNEHVLQLACYLALEGKTIGNLYLLLSGRIVRIQLLDGIAFLRLALTRFDKKIVGDLLVDIADFKRKLAAGESLMSISLIKSVSPETPTIDPSLLSSKAYKYLNLPK